MPAAGRPDPPAFILRSATCLAALFQIRLLAGDLADTFFFCVALLAATGIGLLLRVLSLRSFPSFLLIILAPLVVRGFIARSGLSVETAGIRNDALLLHFDQNLFVVLFPFLWAAISAYFAVASHRFTRWEQLADTAIVLLLFAFQPSKFFAAYERPLYLVAAFSVFAFLQLLVLLAANPARPSIREKVGATAVAFALCLFLGMLLLRPFEEGSVDSGGGLLKPNLMRFDFSQYLRLESEISLSDDLVLIVRKEADDSHILLRRFIISGYDRKRGFFRDPESDETEHPAHIPDSTHDFPGIAFKETRTTEQEYFFVNFDPAAFIALARPKRVVPYASWDASSFNSAYSVISETSEALPFELSTSVAESAGPAALHLSDSEYRRYTDYGEDERVAALAKVMVDGIDGYWDRIQAVYERLKYGEYRYSLKPGIASDGDQLGFFLFDSKKGYCSYFAFSMTLLLRSLGIPARVAVGFFVDTSAGAFNYYPVRADMAHAWVEVYFPDYGWIEYDPTTDRLASGEEFRFSSGVAPELFERLMREILENRDRLSAKRASDAVMSMRSLPSIIRATTSFIARVWVYLAVIAWVLLSLGMRAGSFILARLPGKPRRRALLLARHAFTRIALAGHRRRKNGTIGAFITRFDAEMSLPTVPIMESLSKARFAPTFDAADLSALFLSYEAFSTAYARRIPLSRRILAWLVPPLARILRAGRIGKKKSLATLLVLTLFSLAIAEDQGPKKGENPADTIHAEAAEAVKAERWDRAVELYREGASAFPDDIRFTLELGDLYAGRALYNLAWEQYKAAERIEPTDPSLLYRLSTTAGRLNLDTVSARYLERVVALRPDDRDAIGDLGWMYFKLHRLRDGERFLLDAIQRLGPDRGFSMTLGTIYSDLFEYELSKKQYLDAITDADANGAKIFSAVAHYNLSILEARHHRYSESFLQTDLSLAEAERASGHLARGELFAKRLDLPKAFAEYHRAYELDVSPLSKINIADAYRVAGRLQEARAYAEEALSTRDVSWMINYGTNINQHRRELHEILSEAYRGLVNIELATPRTDPADAIIGLFRAGVYAIRGVAHQARFRSYSYEVAASYEKEGQRLDALINYYNAFQSYPDRALRYLEDARQFECRKIPQAEPSYELEEGRLLADSARLDKAIGTLDPLWERDLLAEAWTEKARLAKRSGSKESTAIAAEKLFALNRGALRQNRIRLPVAVDIAHPAEPQKVAIAGKERRSLQATLKASGFAPYRDGSRFRLSIKIGNGNAYCDLIDGGRGTTIVRKTIPLPSLSRKDRAAFGRDLANAVFRVE